MTRSNKNSDLTPAELYAVTLSNEEPNYYAMIPAVIYHCTYLTDKKNDQLKTVRKKLTTHAITLYGFLKQLAGKKGFEWGSRDYLAKMTGMSAGMITNAKRELSQPMEQLNGKTLITIIKKQRRKFNETTQKIQFNEYDEIHIPNIWPENNAYMVTLDYQEKMELGDVDNSYTPSSNDREVKTPSSNDLPPREAKSPGVTNKNQKKKKHSDKELEAAASPPDLLLSTSRISEDRERLKDMLSKSGCDDNFIKDMFRQYTDTQIKEACKATRKAIENKQVKNPCGYLRKILRNLK